MLSKWILATPVVLTIALTIAVLTMGTAGLWGSEEHCQLWPSQVECPNEHAELLKRLQDNTARNRVRVVEDRLLELDLRVGELDKKFRR